MFQFIHSVLIRLKPISPKDCIVRKIDRDKLIEALIYEEEEFYGSASINKEQFYKERINTDDWKLFLSKFQPTDELCFFKYPTKYWMKLSGRQGYAIIRNGKLVDSIITRMN